ncbi:bile salt-activated lipase [Astyanax mexicanus]|uniref:bile salt-activated lipase n=1 Tax=Astyanax mexicanus TaxID=7994 RepID=UPI0020CAF394|nr:bile salt-activated lipase [Astyanax mexicanus]
MAVLGILAALGIFLGAANAATLGVVSTEGGMVEGKSNGVGLFRYMDVFKGVPFAAPPGRFQKPVPHPGWTGVLKATGFGKKCLQLNEFQTGTHGSEDCLYLNIWVPQGHSVSTGLAVMVYFHGGAFLLGESQGPNYLDNYLYSGEEIADRGNVIVVTVNYRLGTLGFLSSGDSELPGNYGLWDQHAAIGWVFRNIKAFGGDPSNITIFGESAGGASVSFQMLSPHNKGMIRRAISQSGVALCPWAFNSNPRTYAEKVAKKVGCPTDQNMISCLKKTDPFRLTLADSVSLISSASNPLVKTLALSPVVDGDFIPDDPSNLFSNAADIDYLAGVNNMDGHMFVFFDVPSVDQPLWITPVEDVKKLLTALTKEKGPKAADSAFQQYSSSWSSKPTNVEIKKTIVDIETDYIFLVPTQTALYLHNKHANTARTYSYLFSEPSRMPIYPSWMGADHADDLQYVFGKPFATPLGYWPHHRRVSKYMIAYWTNFAKTGDPNSGPSEVPVTWPRLTGQDHQFVDINNSMGKTSVKQKLRSRFVHFWTNTFISFPNVN